MADQNQTPNTVEEEIDIDQLIEEVVVNNYDKSFVPKIHQAMLSELRRIKFDEVQRASLDESSVRSFCHSC